MKVKTRPGDFVVTERLAPRPQARGEWAVWRLEKEGLTTDAARHALAAALGVEAERVKPAGRKDRHARAIQHFGARAGGPGELAGAGWRARRLGWTDAPPGADWIAGNEFAVLLRDLAPALAAALPPALAKLARAGFPNYYDDQRLAAARGGDWVGRRILRRESELALRAFFAPAPEDRAAGRLRRMEFLAQWGKFKKCLEAAATPGEIAAFTPLSRDRRAFSAALNALPADEIFFHVTAYQAFLWDRIAARALAEFPAAAILSSRAGDLPLPERAPEGWAGMNLPLPGKNGSFPPAIAPHAEAVFAREGIAPRQFKVDKIAAAHFKPSARRAWVVPERLNAAPPRPDELHPGRLALALSFGLPSGSYATILIKAAAALAAGA